MLNEYKIVNKTNYINILIDGIDYTSYLHLLEKIEKVENIKSIEINPIIGNLLIEYDNDKINIEEINNIIYNLGFNVLDDYKDQKKDIFVLNNQLTISIISTVIIYILNIDYLDGYLPQSLQNNMFDFLFVSLTQIYCASGLLKDSYNYLKNKIFSYHLLEIFFIFYIYILSSIEALSPNTTLGVRTYFIEFSFLISIVLFQKYLFINVKDKLIDQDKENKKTFNSEKYKKLLYSNISINSNLFKRNRKLLRYYPTFILFIGIVSFLFWLIYDRFSGIGNALMIAVSPIMINLPLLMTLSLSLPFSNYFLFKGLKKKFYYKNSKSIESLAKVDTLIFDKKVVIVDKIPMVTDIFTFNEFDGNIVLKIAASIENQIYNNISKAIVKEAKNRDFDLYTPTSINHTLGVGIESMVNSYHVFIGSREFMKMKSINTTIMDKIANKVSSELKTPIFVAINGKPAGIIATQNIVKKDAINLNEEMKKINITSILITGDSLKSGITYGESLGLEQKNIYTDCIPSKKLKVIEDLKKVNHKIAILKNDSESDYYKMLNDIVISIDKKSSYDFENDISILNSDIETLKETFICSNKIMRQTRQNLFISYMFTMIGLIFASGLLIELTWIHQSPVFWGISTTISVIFVILNSSSNDKNK